MNPDQPAGSGAGGPATGRPFVRLEWPAAGWVVLAIGVALGVLTQIGQSALPDGWSQAANSISPWLLVVFLVGAALPGPRGAALAGAAILLLALVGYYATVFVRYGYGGGTTSLALWSIGAVAGGPVFGIAGRWWVDERRWRRGAAIGLLAAAAIAEGWYLRGILPDASIGNAFIAVGLIVPFVLGRTWRDRIAGYLGTALGLALGTLGYATFLVLYAVLTTVS